MFIMTLGCSDLDTPEVGGMNEPNNINENEHNVTYGLLGPGPVNYGVINDQRRPHQENELNHTGLSYRDPKAARQDIGEDQDMIENIVYETEGVTPGMVVIVGGQAWVNIMFNDNGQGLTQQDQDQKVSEVEEKLKQANPRYEYRVSVNDRT